MEYAPSLIPTVHIVYCRTILIFLAGLLGFVHIRKISVLVIFTLYIQRLFVPICCNEISLPYRNRYIYDMSSIIHGENYCLKNSVGPTWVEYVREWFTAVSTITKPHIFWAVFATTHQTYKAVRVVRAISFVFCTALIGCTTSITIPSEFIPCFRITFTVARNRTLTICRGLFLK